MRRKYLALAVISTAALLAASAANADGWGGRGDREVVVEWNQALQDTMPAITPFLQLRNFAILHIAMFDAVNSIEDDFTRYHVRVRASRGASAEAAAAQAGHDVLVALIPAQAAAYDALLAQRLATIAPGRALQGVAVGKAVARAILEWRANDGALGPAVPFALPNLPGLWQPTSPGVPAGGTQMPTTLPFVLLTPTQFLPPRFPEISSEAYAIDFNEVKDVGSAGSTVRTDEQTRQARLTAGVITRTTFLAAWGHVARDASRDRGLSLDETARVFALLFASMHDGVQTSMTSKFVYALWRPLTAIRRADEDLNAGTTPDATWTPLIATPPYPSYAGNVACISASAAEALGLAFGTDDFPFSVLWLGNAGNPDVARSYTGFWEFARERADSRVWGGIHYRFDNDASQYVCPKVAQFAHARYMRPRHH